MQQAGGPHDGQDEAAAEVQAQLAAARAEAQVLAEELAGLRADVETWRARALAGWAEAAATVESSGHGRDAATLARELDRIEHSLSWRVTAPLRAAGMGARVRSLAGRVRRR